MKHSIVILSVLAVLSMAGCDKPTLSFGGAAPAGAPGPAGPPGKQGETGSEGTKGDDGKPGSSTTVVVTPPASEAPKN